MTGAEIGNLIRTALRQGGGVSSDFDLNPSAASDGTRTLRPAAVLAPILAADGDPQMILTRRASGLGLHPGQIAFPGGKVEAGDDSAVAAALREAKEEIGLPPDAVEILGALPDHETVTDFAVSPIIGLIGEPVELAAAPDETEEIFTVPLSHVTDPERFFIRSRYWHGGRRYYYAVPYGPYYIWGATARILLGLAQRLSR